MIYLPMPIPNKPGWVHHALGEHEPCLGTGCETCDETGTDPKWACDYCRTRHWVSWDDPDGPGLPWNIGEVMEPGGITVCHRPACVEAYCTEYADERAEELEHRTREAAAADPEVAA